MMGKRFLVCLIAGLAGLFMAEAFCLAGRKDRDAPVERKFTTELMVGIRKMGHYANANLVTTIPPTLMVEGQLAFWDRDIAAFYLLYSKSLLLASTTTLGGGIKFGFLNFRGKGKSWINGISIIAIGDAVHYATEPPVSPKIYDYSGNYLRLGLGANVKIGGMGTYLDATLLGTRISTAFVIAPFVGVGFRF
jgi:hypothetical protein